MPGQGPHPQPLHFSQGLSETVCPVWALQLMEVEKKLEEVQQRALTDKNVC